MVSGLNPLQFSESFCRRVCGRGFRSLRDMGRETQGRYDGQVVRKGLEVGRRRACQCLAPSMLLHMLFLRG